MSGKRHLWAAVLGIAFAALPAPPAPSQTLTVVDSGLERSLSVPVNRAVVVESDVPFAELSIANPEIADISSLSDRAIYVLGRAPGRTTLTLIGATGELITNVEVQVAPDVAEFKERLRQILPREPIEVRTANDGIVLSGTVSSITALDRALDLASRYAPDRVSNLMDVGGTQQVMLKVRFAEMQRSVRKGLASGLTAVALGDDAGLSAAAGTASLVPGTALGAGDSVVQNVAPGTFGALGLGFTVGEVVLSVLLEALETKGLVRTLSEPNLTALSGQEASFLAGGEYPVPVVDEDGGITIDYKPIGVELTFVPRVIDNGRINLELNAAVSSIDPSITIQNDGFSVNAFRRRETTTTVEMRQGESFAIAGLLEDDFRDTVGQLPWAGDIPVLGTLFRSSEYERSQSELVIIVTPHLVAPVSGAALAMPTDRIRPPTEAEFFLRGQVGAPLAGAAAEVARQDFGGSYGYVMD
jgi:pilus assembly protein CpaC